MDELLEQFLIESRDLVAQAAADFAALGGAPDDGKAVESAFRAIHTLKGSVGIFAFDPAERVLHHAEDILDRARKHAGAFDAAAIATLVACLDQTDRWIDEVERSGGLGEGAAAIADRLIGRHPTAPQRSPAAQAAPWLTDLCERESDAIGQAEGPLVAFRYTPDANCFFRGDDPLAVVAGVPGLLTLTIAPADGGWPDADAIEPFTCFSALEGLSAAAPHDVRAAFRLVSDQVVAAPVAAGAGTDVDRAAAQEDSRSQTLRVDAGRVAALADGVGELLVAVHGVAALAEEAEAADRGLAARIRAAQADLERLAGNLSRAVGAVRSVPLEPTLRRLPRIAREIAASLGKEVDFAITGQGVEVDKQIADGLYEPLLHLLRNAIDHGIETAERRGAAGKPARGSIALAFRRDGDTIEAVLRDDGAGIDPASVRRIAVERGLVSAEAAASQSDAEAVQLIFAPGFSTADAVTGISGRGVGMNAVQAAIEALRGTVEVGSEPGRGTRFRLRLPANVLTTRLLVVEAGGDRYGVALDQVIETVRIAPAQLLPVGDGLACVLRERTVPVLDLAALLGGVSREAGDGVKLLVTRSHGDPVALRVDGVGSRIDTLVRPPNGLLASVPGIRGSALLGDGGVLLVLDLPELAA